MKLLFDQNLSPKLPGRLFDLYPDSVHVRNIGMQAASVTTIWNHAKQNGLRIVSKGSDFQQLSLLLGHPPKFVWLRLGNCPVQLDEELLRRYSAVIHTFEQRAAESHLMLP